MPQEDHPTSRYLNDQQNNAIKPPKQNDVIKSLKRDQNEAIKPLKRHDVKSHERDLSMFPYK